MSRRGWLIAAGAVVLVTVLVLLAPSSPPYALTSTEADGTDIARRILVDEFGVEVVAATTVTDAGGLDGRDVVVVFEDRLGDVDESAITAHVAGGGRAVVADPRSSLADVEVVGQEVLRGAPDCPLLPGTRVGPRPGPYDEGVVDATYRSFTPPDSATDVCWEGTAPDGGAYLAVVPTPAGGATLVLGSPTALTNAMLANRSGTTALVPLLVPGPGGRVVVVRGDGAPPMGDEAPAGAVPQRLRDAMALLALAGVLYLLAHVRRLGGVVTREPPVRVPAAELAMGVADLLQRHGHAQHAADHVRAGLRADLDRLLGTAGADDAAVVALLARSTDLDEARAAPAVVAGPVADDDALVGVVAAAHLVRDHLGLAPRPTSDDQAPDDRAPGDRARDALLLPRADLAAGPATATPTMSDDPPEAGQRPDE